MSGERVSELMQALYRSDDAARDALLAAGHRPDVLEAAALGDLGALRAHLSSDADAWRTRAADGFTPLHYAAYFGGAAAVRLLLEAGAAPNGDADNELGVRPLHSAASVGDVDAARALLEAGADPDVAQRGGFTPLHAAAHSDNAELARVLLDHGADPDLADDSGTTPRAMARSQVAAVLAG